MKNYPLISVIIPVYNVEKYLRRCVDSILNQTYPNLEIILVNDGSTDNSLQICEKYAKKNSSIKIINKSNGGQSSARNFGLNYAHGEYVGFIDSDDWIAPDMYMHLYQILNEYNADVAQCNLILASSEKIKISDHESEAKLIIGRNNILEYFLETSTKRSGGYTVWRCLFPLSIAKRFKFREGKINEDIDWKYKVLSLCERFVDSDKVGYYYFQSGDSTSTGTLKKRDFDLFDAANELFELTNKENNERIRFYGQVKKARTPFSLLCRIAYFGIDKNIGDKNQIINNLKRLHRKNLFILLKSPMSLGRKILAIAFAINYQMTEKAVKLIMK